MKHTFTLPYVYVVNGDVDPNLHYLDWPKTFEHDEYLTPSLIEVIKTAGFKLNHESYAAVMYCQYKATNERKNLLYQSFDTEIRDQLQRPGIAFTQSFFTLLGHAISPFPTDLKNPMTWWAELAGFLFWMGRTGSGLYYSHANFRPGFAGVFPDMHAKFKNPK